MGVIATKFGRVFGPMGKMPSPQAGIIPQESEETITQMLEKVKKSIRVRTKERSIKLPMGREDMSDKDLIENILATLKALEKILPRNKDNIKNVLVKFTMTKPVRLDMYNKVVREKKGLEKESEEEVVEKVKSEEKKDE